MFNTAGTLFQKGSLTSRPELFEKVNLLLQESAELQMRANACQQQPMILNYMKEHNLKLGQVVSYYLNKDIHLFHTDSGDE